MSTTTSTNSTPASTQPLPRYFTEEGRARIERLRAENFSWEAQQSTMGFVPHACVVGLVPAAYTYQSGSSGGSPF